MRHGSRTPSMAAISLMRSCYSARQGTQHKRGTSVGRTNHCNDRIPDERDTTHHDFARLVQQRNTGLVAVVLRVQSAVLLFGRFVLAADSVIVIENVHVRGVGRTVSLLHRQRMLLAVLRLRLTLAGAR